MTVIENKLLRCKRTQAVPQQDIRFARVFPLSDNSERNHVFNELIEPTRPEFAKTSGRLCRQAMTSVIVSVNDKPITNQDIGKLAIASDVLTKSVGDLNDSPNVVMAAPFHARYGEVVSTRKLESLWLSHTSFTRD